MHGQILSLTYMRGFAALLVFYAHVFVVGISDPVTPKFFLPMIINTPLEHSVAAGTDLYIRPEGIISIFGLSSGHLGVALFFLISGFVIPKSIEKTGAIPFLIGRFFRIIPLCALVTFLVAGIIWSADTAYGVSCPYTLKNTLTSSVLLSWLFDEDYTIPVIWSLIVEVYFYIIIALTFYIFKKITSLHLLLIALASFVLVNLNSKLQKIFADDYLFSHIIEHIAYSSCFLILILIGSIGYKIYYSDKNIMINFCLSVLFLILFYLSIIIFNISGIGIIDFGMSNAYLALIFFISGLVLNKDMKQSKIAKFFADISYPLYLIHIPLAWIILYFLYSHGFPATFCLAFVTFFCIVLAWLLHYFVEKPTHNLGKYLATKALAVSMARMLNKTLA